jgi:hypothetical protein
MTEVKSIVESNSILNDFRWESVALVQFWLSHELNTGRLRVNLSAPYLVKDDTLKGMLP